MTDMEQRIGGKPALARALGEVGAGVLTAAAVGIPMAFAYAYAEAYTPGGGKAHGILGALLGLLMGTAVGLRSWGGVRRTAAAMAATAVGALPVFYTLWAVWVYAVLRRADVGVSLGALLMRPDLLWSTILKLNATGTYSTCLGESCSTDTGLVLWIKWVLETVWIMGTALWGAALGRAMRDPAKPAIIAAGGAASGGRTSL